jgi:hypothetical protein
VQLSVPRGDVENVIHEVNVVIKAETLYELKEVDIVDDV